MEPIGALNFPYSPDNVAEVIPFQHQSPKQTRILYDEVDLSSADSASVLSWFSANPKL